MLSIVMGSRAAFQTKNELVVWLAALSTAVSTLIGRRWSSSVHRQNQLAEWTKALARLDCHMTKGYQKTTKLTSQDKLCVWCQNCMGLNLIVPNPCSPLTGKSPTSSSNCLRARRQRQFDWKAPTTDGGCVDTVSGEHTDCPRTNSSWLVVVDDYELIELNEEITST